MSVTGSNVYVISASRQRSSPALSRHEIPLSLTIIPAGGNTVHGPDDNARPDRNHREQQHSWLRFSPLLSPGRIGGTKRDQAKRTPKRPGFNKNKYTARSAIPPAASRWICPLCPPLQASGKRMGCRWRSSQGANSSANLLRLAGRSRVRTSLLCLSVIARMHTSPSLSSDCFFAFGGVYYSVEIPPFTCI